MNMRVPVVALLLFAASSSWAQQPKDPEPPAEEPTLVEPPRLERVIPAEIPPGTEFPADEVVVILAIEVGADGKVGEVTIQSGAGEPFDTAALDAARKFRFAPALLSNGEHVPVTVTFRMRIQKPPEPPPPPPKPDPVVFSGQLLERGTRVPLAGVEVQALGDDRVLASTATDDEGRFRLEVPAPVFGLAAVPAGHEPLQAPVEAVPGEERQEVFYLETTGTAFETVIRAKTVRREVTKQVLPKEVVEKIPGTQGDTLKVVQNLPGVARAPFLSGQLILRGASPGDSRIFLEGQEIPVLYHFGVLRSTFNSAFLEAVEFIPGNFGPVYGRATGGVVDVRVRDPADDMFRGEADINVYDAGFVLEGPLSESWSIGGAFHRSWVDTFLGAVVPEDAGLTFDTAPRYYDYQLLSTYQPDRDHKLRLLFYGSMDKLELLFERPAGDPAIRGAVRGRIMFHNLQASYFHRFSPVLSQKSSVQIGYQEIRTDLGPDLFFNLSVYRLSARTAWTWEPLAWMQLRAGMDIRLDGVTIDLNSPLRPIEGESTPPTSTQQVFGVEQSATLYEPAAFLEMRLEPVEGLTVLPSLRLDYYRNIGRFTLDPRLVVRYQLLAGTVIKGGVGIYQQPPTPDQAVEELGNPDLMALRSSHSSLGVEQSIIEGLDVELTGFYKWLDRQVIRNPAFFSDPAAVPYLSGGTGRIIGLELLVKARIAGFNGWLAYTYQRSYRKNGPGAEERLFDFDQPHILTLVGSYDFGSGWSAGLRFRLVSGQPVTPVIGAVYDAQSDTWVPLFGRTNSARAGAFHQLDLRVDKTWTFDLWKLSLYLEVLNAYNRGNPEGFQYNFDYTERQTLTGLPILPVLGIKGEW